MVVILMEDQLHEFCITRWENVWKKNFYDKMTCRIFVGSERLFDEIGFSFYYSEILFSDIVQFGMYWITYLRGVINKSFFIISLFHSFLLSFFHSFFVSLFLSFVLSLFLCFISFFHYFLLSFLLSFVIPF